MHQRLYFDHAATTPLDPAALEAMLPFLREAYGNPSGLYAEGRAARRAVDEARDLVAELLGAGSPSEIVFTGSGSEADNLALKGVALAARAAGDRRDHIVTARTEHHAVLHTVAFLQTQGFQVTYVPVDAFGRVEPAALEEVLTDRTLIVSLMHANNEVGTLHSVAELSARCRPRGILFHTDAVQTVGHLPVDVDQLGVDLLSLSAHKFYGPKGVGALYVRRGVRLLSHVHGGGQERERRAGTENVAGVVGLAAALQVAVQSLPQTAEAVRALRDRLIAGVERIEGARLSGHRSQRLPGNAHFTFNGVDGESLLLNLDMQGIAASAGSACSAGSVEPSYVLTAMGYDRDRASRALRLTLGRHTTPEAVDRVVRVLPALIQKLRTRSAAHA